MQCDSCVHAKRNQGIVIPVGEVPFFCLSVERIKDPEIARILGPWMQSQSGAGLCPGYDGGTVTADSYRAVDQPLNPGVFLSRR